MDSRSGAAFQPIVPPCRVLLSGLSEQESAAYLKRAELKRTTPKTVVDRAGLAEISPQLKVKGFAINRLTMKNSNWPSFNCSTVKDRKERIVAGMNIVIHTARVSVSEMMNRLLAILREHGKMLGKSLGKTCTFSRCSLIDRSVALAYAVSHILPMIAHVRNDSAAQSISERRVCEQNGSFSDRAEDSKDHF